MAQQRLYLFFFWVFDNTFYSIKSAYLSNLNFSECISKVDEGIADVHACKITFDCGRWF